MSEQQSPPPGSWLAADGHWYPPETHPLAQAPLPSRVALRVAWGLGGAVLGMLAFVPMVRLFVVVLGGLAGFGVAFLVALAATAR